MCGITGFLQRAGFADAEAAATVRAMAGALAHRGPDDAGEWTDGAAGVALGHRRLAILDVSAAGHQPMLSPSGRFALTFNGEIYNHLELRDALGGARWRGTSDTETLLAAFERWGIADTLRRAAGMFALGVWDREQRRLSLARDRLGEKPLYAGLQGSAFLFGSELKALRRHPSFEGAIDRDSVWLLLDSGYIPAPHSIYHGISKLAPGTILHVADCGLQLATESYWSLHDAWENGAAHPFSGSPAEAADELTVLLRTAVTGQQLSDVPLGAFLSGGIDSSTVVALMQASRGNPVRTFTIGFADQSHDESGHARAVAQHLGTDHTELMLTEREVLAAIPRMPEVFDEPFGDASQVPTFLVAQLARRHVTVALSGDAGDELFGGYGHYQYLPRLWQPAAGLPLGLRRAAASVAAALPSALVDGAGRPLIALRGRRALIPPTERMRALAAGYAAGDDLGFYRAVASQWRQPERFVRAGRDPRQPLGIPPSLRSFPERMMYLDAATYLPDDILAKVDRAAMASSLETRVPMLDHRVVEFAARLPLAMKLSGGRGKRVLRDVLSRLVPPALTERPKMGFSVPAHRWLREGQVREWAEDLLTEERLRADGVLESKAVRKRWLEHQAGRYDWQASLWTVLMFQAWLHTDHAGRDRAPALSRPA